MSLGKTDYYDVEVENGRIMLTPVRIQNADAVRAKLEALGINAWDVSDALEWARESRTESNARAVASYSIPTASFLLCYSQRKKWHGCAIVGNPVRLFH